MNRKLNLSVQRIVKLTPDGEQSARKEIKNKCPIKLECVILYSTLVNCNIISLEQAKCITNNAVSIQQILCILALLRVRVRAPNQDCLIGCFWKRRTCDPWGLYCIRRRTAQPWSSDQPRGYSEKPLGLVWPLTPMKQTSLKGKHK